MLTKVPCCPRPPVPVYSFKWSNSKQSSIAKLACQQGTQRRQGEIMASAAPHQHSAPAAAAATPLLRANVNQAPDEALVRALRGAAEAHGPTARVYVYIRDDSSAAAASAALLDWLAHLYRAVADAAPRLDVVPLCQCAGWDQEAAEALAAGGRPAAAATAVSSGSGQGGAGDKAAVARQSAQPSSSSNNNGNNGSSSSSSSSAYAFTHVAVGGTFDRLHAGHRLLLAATALAATRFVYAGVTADELLAKKAHREWLEPFDTRAAAAASFMRAVRPSLAVEAGALRDPAAPTQAELDPGMQALVVSRETLAGGEAINRGRAARGFAPLALVVVGVVGERPDGSKLSSSELRGADAAAAGAGAGPQQQQP